MTSLPQTPELGSVRQAYLQQQRVSNFYLCKNGVIYTRPLKVLVYWLKMTGGGLHPKVPEVQGLPVVVKLSTGLQLSSYTCPRYRKAC
jgi:hypothetical protein